MSIDTAAFRALLEEHIPFNRHLGLEVAAYDPDSARVTTRLRLRPEFVGNALRGMPHGGVISFLVDATAGGAAVLSLDELALSDRVATLDMRVDYVQPARGEELRAEAVVVRRGRRAIVVRTEVHDDTGTLVALGTNVFYVVR